MTTVNRVDPAEGSPLRAELSAVEIDIRCALVLSRIALETLAEVKPECEIRIRNSLDEAIADARMEDSAGSEAVISLLAGFKQRLTEQSEQARVLYLE